MTRIGFAYNQKPESIAADDAAELARADEEPPSSGSGVATLLAPAPAAQEPAARRAWRRSAVSFSSSRW